jgi:hypothetical protein
MRAPGLQQIPKPQQRQTEVYRTLSSYRRFSPVGWFRLLAPKMVKWVFRSREGVNESPG